MHEWPLIIFTLLVQASVGITLFTTFSLVMAEQGLSSQEKHCYALPFMLFAFIAGALGLMVSTAHLGYPLNAFHALRHVESSWLSREIIFASLYLAFLGLGTLIALLKKRLPIVLLLIASLLGIVDVFCMSSIYVHSSVVTWMHFNTYLMFFGSVLSLGAVGSLWSLAVRPDLPSPLTRKVAVTAAVLLIAITLCRLLAQPLYMEYLTSVWSSDVITFPHQPLVAFAQLASLRLASWVILIAGVCALALSSRCHRINKRWLTMGSGLIVVAEVLLRLGFFSIQ
ncbi:MULTISPECIES: DmsC/YnfH family molybdoenzyme membrane anchor subunit [unclassified Serratia (in: enterobacteria)]|uniref:dimethyl sulfoxide reductase anchor subunit family protein n=1 Tax=unclassified Serratia (in: enterobacteria) TaxID=2647522 RepID=UPI00046A7D86|nr:MULTISPECIES: DmsC/YnfH family molybdoenzyme membrane anchor subunit [unclassified Serratia (in: enterobacteria)]